MLKQILFFCSIVILASGLTLAQENPDKEQEENVQGEEITTSETTENREELQTETVWNKVCPVRGNPIEDDTPTVEYDGKVYGFCCPGCDIKFAKNPEKFSKNLSEDGSKFIGRR
jgi:YHS domain-containing protein